MIRRLLGTIALVVERDRPRCLWQSAELDLHEEVRRIARLSDPLSEIERD